MLCQDMYLRVKQVRQGERVYNYLQLVEGARLKGKVRQRVVATLGRLEELKQSGKLDQLAAAFARHDPPRIGIRREVGPLLAVAHYIEKLGIKDIIDAALPPRGKTELSVGEVIVALIANRLAAPAPLYDIAGWASQAAIHEIFGVPSMLLNDDRLGRALEHFHPHAEAVRGAAALKAIERFGVDAGRLHLDLTALRMEGSYENSSLVAKGWGGPDRRIFRQVKALAATNPDGIPLYIRPHSGDTAELSAVGSALERLAQLLPPGLIACADSSFGHFKTLCAAHEFGLRFVVPLREASDFRKIFLREVGHDALRSIRYISRRERNFPPDKRTVYRGTLRPFSVASSGRGETHRFRVAYIFSSEEAEAVAESRERSLSRAEESLGRIRNGLSGRYYKTKNAVVNKVATILTPNIKDLLRVEIGTKNRKPTLRFFRDNKAIQAASETDGIFALVTNLPGKLTAGQLLRIYKNQSLVECAHRNLKGPLKVRPIFLHNDDRIQALVSVVGLALLVFGLIEADVRKALGDGEELPGLLPEGRSARPTGRNVLAAFQGLGLTYTINGIVLDQLTYTQRRILELLEVPILWPQAGDVGLNECGKRA